MSKVLHRRHYRDLTKLEDIARNLAMQLKFIQSLTGFHSHCSVTNISVQCNIY